MRRAVEQCRGGVQIAAGGGALCLGKQRTLALRADLRAEEGNPRMIRVQRTCGLAQALCAVEIAGAQLRLGVTQQPLDDLLEAVDGARVARAQAQRRAIQFGGVLAGGRDERAAVEGMIGARQQTLEGRIPGLARQRLRGRVRMEPAQQQQPARPALLLSSPWRRHAASTNSFTRCSESGLCRKRYTDPEAMRPASACCSAPPPTATSTRSGNCL